MKNPISSHFKPSGGRGMLPRLSWIGIRKAALSHTELISCPLLMWVGVSQWLSGDKHLVGVYAQSLPAPADCWRYLPPGARWAHLPPSAPDSPQLPEEEPPRNPPATLLQPSHNTVRTLPPVSSSPRHHTLYTLMWAAYCMFYGDYLISLDLFYCKCIQK